MEEPFDLSGPSFGPVSGGKPAKLVILLHGVGADGDDLIGLAPRFARVLPDAGFLSPHAPYAYDMAPVGRQWFSLADRTPSRMLAGIRATAPILSGFIDRELERRGLADRDLALIGFSQGAMMALYVALRRADACAALIGYSGALAGSERLTDEIRARPPVLLVHGAADEVVPAELHSPAVAALEACGVKVSAHIRPGLGHGIDEEGIRLGTEFLASAFAGRQAGSG
ncbi:MAG: prolyl oligopeptidase family serine peptidase [Proteobacteria bacterium]|nr:prolyl oligopeptidase family serine peptidase [Pseudomonadota bacterium]